MCNFFSIVLAEAAHRPASAIAGGRPAIAINKPLAFASTTQRTAHRRAIDTLRSDHNQMLKRLAALPVPPAPSVYDTHSELGFLLLDQIVYLRALVDAFAPLFERCADDAADHGGARAESFDLIRGAAEDFIAPISSAAEELSGEG